MDLDDLDDTPKPAPARRVSRFAPKISKLVLKSEPEAAPSGTGTEVRAESIRDELMSDEREVKQEDDVKQEAAVVNDDVGDGGDDVVVREIDVYFTPSVDDDTKLYIMQYVLRPVWRPYDLDEHCQEVRVKPKTAEVEMDLAINDSTNWDSDSANKLKMEKQTLSTSWTPTPSTSFVVGLLMGDKLHLNPVDAVVQLRPSLDLLKSGVSKRKSNVASDAESAVKLKGSTQDKPIGQTKKQQNKQVESANAQNTDFEEHWIPLKYNSSKSESSSRYLQKMAKHESSSIEFKMSPYDYLDSLCPTESNYGKPHYPSRRFLLSLPLEERIERLLLEGPPTRCFNTIKHFIANDSIDDVLRYLQKYGQLVQGLWAPKTSLLFPNRNPSDNLKMAARDYVLALFNNSTIINLLEIDVPMKIRENMKPFLKLFADRRPSENYWTFKEKSDEAFKQDYPDIVNKQLAAYAVVLEQIMEKSRKSDANNKVGRKLGVTENPPKLSMTDSTMKKGGGGGGVIQKTITNEIRDALLKALPKVFQNHQVCSFRFICQRLRDLAISQSNIPKAVSKTYKVAAKGVDAPPDELRQILSEVATNIHGSYVLKSSLDHPELDWLRKVVIDLLVARGVDASLRKAEVIAAARQAHQKEVSSQEYNKVMTEICMSKGSLWVLKSGDGVLS